MYCIQNTTLNDLDSSLDLYRNAVRYQKEKGYNLWPEFERSLIEGEINAGRHYKILVDNKIACVFSVLYNDPIIWEDKDLFPSVYLHRIATNPEYKGMRWMQVITDWGIEHAKKNNRQFVRMDTWGNNENLKNYYCGFGFTHVGKISLPENHELPSH